MKNKRVLVVGTGLSGIAAVKLLTNRVAEILLLEGNENAKEEEIMGKLPEEAKVEVIIGQLSQEKKEQVDLVILSPGVPTDLPFVNEFRENEIPIWGEIELAYQFSKGRVAAITGTNGKTTTTALVGEIMKSYYESVYVVGNIGTPYTGVALDTQENSVVVAEVSSFQLETIETFRPEVSAILNITPDHLNRHHTMENYIETKWKVAKNQDETNVCVLNYEDVQLRKDAAKLKAKVVFFSSERSLEEGVYLDDNGDIFMVEDNHKTLVFNIKDLKLIGKHSYENVMAAIGITWYMKVPLEYIRKATCDFEAVEHRIEYVAEKKGVKYYNDSKGTNPDAAIKGIQAMISPTILIGGGYDKQSDYKEWILAFQGKVRYLVLMGQTREKIAETAKECGFQDIIFVESMEEAVLVSVAKARPGDAVLLSPACASWGMFKDYEERGRIFKECVNGIK